jgi:hypothetical protein
MKSKILSLILVTCFLGMIVAVPITPASALEMEYFPLAPGSSLIYNSTDDSSDWMTKRYIDEQWDFLGGPLGTFAVRWGEAHMMPGEDNYTWINHMWLSKTADTLLWWGFEDANAKIVCGSPLNYVTEPVEAGAVHRGSTSGTLTIKATSTVMNGVPFSANYTIEAIESVTVPAGTFADCIKIHEEEITPDGSISFWVWYAPNVGAVQYYYPQQNERWDYLLEYTVDPENDPWNGWFMPQVPQLLRLTIVAVGAIAVVAVVAIFIKRRR